MAVVTFPQTFLWGSATAAYQIEGGAREGGRGESIWDHFSHTPGKTADGDTGDLACDHFHRYREDIALMGELGLKAYRFSISWPRLFPEGVGNLNQEGLDFYGRLVDELLSAGITPVPTLYHWDLPQALQEKGGWPNRDTAAHFADYAEAAFRGLGDRVNQWITLNEPWCVAHLGYYSGEHAPGNRDLAQALAAGHTQLLAHGEAVRRFREICPEGKIGITDNFSAVRPATDSDADRAAANRWAAYMNRWFLDPIFRGDYPQELREAFGDALPVIADDERSVVQSPIDFVGVNYYSPSYMADDPNGGPLKIRGVDRPDEQHTEMGWIVDASGLYDVLTWLDAEYGHPTLFVTENGAAFDDGVEADGSIYDEDRRLYLREHLRAAHQAITSGVRLAGYFVWSLLDNFEWAFGYSRRFGIVHVDFQTQKRTPKQSALWYSQVVRQNAVGDD